jgi:hypothetical protein
MVSHGEGQMKNRKAILEESGFNGQEKKKIGDGVHTRAQTLDSRFRPEME